MHLGLNADPVHWNDQAELVRRLKDADAAFAVFPYDVSQEACYPAFAAACAQGRVEPIPVFASQSMKPEDGGDYRVEPLD